VQICACSFLQDDDVIHPFSFRHDGDRKQSEPRKRWRLYLPRRSNRKRRMSRDPRSIKTLLVDLDFALEVAAFYQGSTLHREFLEKLPTFNV
jgi:hypothetical protein